jgi:hypothetical protein
MHHWRNGLLIFLATLPAAGHASGPDIVIVPSSDNSYFSETIETLINHVDREARFRVVDASDLEALAENSAHHRFYVALGVAAVREVQRLAGDAVAFNAYLTHEQYLRMRPSGQLSILLDQPLPRYLAFCKLLLDLDSVGLLHNDPPAPDAAESRVLDALNFSLNRYRVAGDDKLLPALRRLLQQNDALLMLPQSELYNRDTLKGVLLTSYRFRKPAISYSPGHVRAGALASIYSSPADIGRHLALVVNRRLRQPQASVPAYEFAHFYSIATNATVARALGLTLPGEAELRTRLQSTAP